MEIKNNSNWVKEEKEIVILGGEGEVTKPVGRSR